ncbi:MAG: UDP-glucose--hexose-1-phosphate uridylyltransferase [Clostridiales bacterium]|nr:UDP-glucose--hexose-1-phosphate uridylyltransferase [Clostridiales bacterium]
MNGVNETIEHLLYYASENLDLGVEDIMYARNQLLELFQAQPSDKKGQPKDLQTEILDELIAYALDKKMIEAGEEIRFETKIMGLVTPSCGLVVSTFEEYRDNLGIKVATDYLYNISIASNYIRLCDIKRNIFWCTLGKYGKVGITINLSKPEKDPKQVLAEKSFQGKKYPKCALCLENLGFPGTLTHPARQTLRVVPIELNGEKWHLQYSPYVYYDEHCIALNDNHVPMEINANTFARLLDFVEIFPHYFLGSNADLPIVGGSILSHDHYQGGKKVLPMFSRPFREIIYQDDNVVMGIKDWYNSVVTIKGKNKQAVHKMADRVLKKWIAYSDESVGILAYTTDRHNTITPIASMCGDEFVMDLILRNNRTDDKHPFGIYHPTEDMHNIKKEGIGLIEAMGLFVLPGRLQAEIKEMISILVSGEVDFIELKENPRMQKHMHMIAEIVAENNQPLDRLTARKLVLKKIENACFRILECTAVFKNNEEGQEAFIRFIKTI